MKSPIKLLWGSNSYEAVFSGSAGLIVFSVSHLHLYYEEEVIREETTCCRPER